MIVPRDLTASDLDESLTPKTETVINIGMRHGNILSG